MKRRALYITLLLSLFVGLSFAHAAEPKPKEDDDFEKTLPILKKGVYVLKKITVQGNQYIDPEVIISLSGLEQGQVISIPGPDISEAITKLWKQQLVGDIRIEAETMSNDDIHLIIKVKEFNRIADFEIKGASDKETEEIIDKTNLRRGIVITPDLKDNITKVVSSHYRKNGYLLSSVDIVEEPSDEMANGVFLSIKVKKNNKQKVHRIRIKGNQLVTESDIRHAMITTKERTRPTLTRRILTNILTLNFLKKKSIVRSGIKKDVIVDEIRGITANFTGSKFAQKTFDEDKVKIINDIYAKRGYIDAKILNEEVKQYDDQCVDITLEVYEGERYKLGSIRWIGNNLQTEKKLRETLDLKEGEWYNQVKFENQLQRDPLKSVSALYKNEGYLFSRLNVKKARIEDNKVDLEIYITEGDRAKIDNVIISNVSYTKDRIVRRYISVIPGEYYSNTDILISRERLAKTGFIDPRNMNIVPLPNYEKKTTDVEFILKEKMDMKALASLGMGAYGLFGRVGFSINNLSMRNLLMLRAPVGDAQSFGFHYEKSKQHNKYTVTFVDPWIGGARPIYLSTEFFYNSQTKTFKDKITPNTNPLLSADAFGGMDPKLKKGYTSYIRSLGTSFSLGKRIKWPTYTTISGGIGYTYHKYSEFEIFEFSKKRYDGDLQDFTINTGIKRDTTNVPFYPTKGHTAFINFKTTPPYSLFKDYNPNDVINNSVSEFHKTSIGASYIQKIVGDLVLVGKTDGGLLGGYSTKYGVGPYRRFFMGGDGVIPGYNPILGQSSVKLRGYSNAYLPRTKPEDNLKYMGGVIFDKFTLELRYPISLDFIVPIYILGFLEGGNAWASYKKFDISEILGYKSYGIGVRAMVPLLGPIGLDFAFGIDRNRKLNPELHLAMGVM